MGTIVIVTYRVEVVVGMHFRNSKSTTLILLEQSQLFRTFPLSIQLLYEHDVLQSDRVTWNSLESVPNELLAKHVYVAVLFGRNITLLIPLAKGMLSLNNFT